MAQRRQNILGKIRLTPAQNVLLGFTKRARRYIDESMLPIVRALETGERALIDVETMSARQYEQARNFVEFGEPLTKEKRTQRLTRWPQTAAKYGGYRTARARETAANERVARPIRATIEGVTPADVALMVRFERHGWLSLTHNKKARFRKLFDKYSRESVLEALGSPPTR